jgi:hypothetical protein
MCKYFATEPAGFFNAEKVVAYLRQLRKQQHEKLDLISDKGRTNKGKIIPEFLRNSINSISNGFQHRHPPIIPSKQSGRG